jgi:pSer/pThr/pTyr-binding forkhead associated (FHA) protein
VSAAPAMKSKPKYRLKIIAGPHQNEIHTLEKEIVKIGRGDDNTIQLPRDGRISRNHVEIYWSGSEFRVKNLSQKNFVMVNERVVQEEVIKPGVKVQIGETLIEVFEDGPILVPKGQDAANSPAPYSPRLAPMQPRAQISANALRVNAPSTSAYAQIPQQPLKQPQRTPRPAQTNSRARFYIILAIVGALVYWLMSGNSKPKEKLTFRTSQEMEYDQLQSEAEKARLEERINSQNNQLIRQAQENLVKGFRDFQQGNYMRAKENFASVLIKDPDNELAKRYYNLSSIKFDELLQFNILQGLRYREKKNYRLCRSSFQSALIMIQNNNKHPKYSEIKNYFDECNLALEGRF